MGLAKLDIYDYIILPGIIRIRIEGTNDPILVDILSAIDHANGKVYVEGYYYIYLDEYQVCSNDSETYMDLEVIEIK